MRRLVLFLALSLTACLELPPQTAGRPPADGSSAPVYTPQEAARTFTEVSRAVTPRAIEECRRRTRDVNCDFRIVVDPDPRAPVNAFQSLDEDGRPVLTFTASMIATVHNPDELAFVMGHEAAHHIQGHLDRQAQNAAAGAAIFAELATITGGNEAAVEDAQKIGAVVGARSYSKEFELEADELGTIITARAGYNPIVGAAFFSRLPDPGDRFLGTHPPNAERVEIVRRTSAQVGF
ncbi:M48 family metallopeptidase [Ruegeria hyattellae]|uniref:M48 family metallopeptidase n=1 Tax=Ruegeria hyattellae TaxID=3233337 RepID=UPI00355B1248